MIECVLLSAGQSERFGSPKALAKINNATNIENLQHKLLKSKLGGLTIVLGAHQDQIRPCVLDHPRITAVFNPEHLRGQTSSFQCGLKAISPQATGVMLMPVDYPVISTAVLDALIDEFAQKQPAILIPVFDNRRGHPPIFHARLKESLLNLPPDQGLNVFEHQHEDDIKLLGVDDPGILRTFNTVEELDEIKKILN